MTDTPTNITITNIVVAFLAAVPPSLLAWAALRQAKASTDKTDVVIKKTDEIHLLTNSNLAKVTSALEVANEKIVGLEKMVSVLVKDNGHSPSPDAPREP